MNADFIDDEWVVQKNNVLERGHYHPLKEEWRQWYLNMPNSRMGMLFDLSAFMKKTNKPKKLYK